MAEVPEFLAITGVGLCSSLGDVVTASAAFRCEMSRPQELEAREYFDSAELEPFKIVGHRVDYVNDGFEYVGRFQVLAGEAYENCLRASFPETINWDKTALFLALPRYPSQEHAEETYPTQADFRAFIDRLVANPVIPDWIAGSEISFTGRSGVLRLINNAFDAVGSGRFTHAVIGAVDSLLSPSRIEEALERRQIKAPSNPQGFAPGEAAVFIVLEAEARSRWPVFSGQLKCARRILNLPMRLQPGRPWRRRLHRPWNEGVCTSRRAATS